MTHDDSIGEREQISRMEAITYIECLLPEFVTLAASQPVLQHLLKMAHLEARAVIREHSGPDHGTSELPPGDGRH